MIRGTTAQFKFKQQMQITGSVSGNLTKSKHKNSVAIGFGNEPTAENSAAIGNSCVPKGQYYQLAS